jgi:hypothetical protein
LNNYVSSALYDAPAKLKEKQTNDSNIRSESSLSFQANLTGKNSFDVLRKKINWATQELTLSNNVKYSIELCEMIKAASEAILALKRTEL